MTTYNHNPRTLTDETANNTLREAAPQLLAALEKILCRAETDYAERYEEEINNTAADEYLNELENARAILAQARGEVKTRECNCMTCQNARYMAHMTA